jgi:predicted GNAT family acetyltransferase
MTAPSQDPFVWKTPPSRTGSGKVRHEMDDIELSVRDESEQGRLVADVEGHEAELVYTIRPDAFVIVHVGTPKHLEGRGIGGAMVRAGVRYARERGLAVVPQCPFAESWLERNPDVASTVEVRPGRS